MTIIVLRAGVMAADTACFSGETMRTMVRKIARAPNGAIGGSSGKASLSTKFRAWMAAGMEGPFAVDDDDEYFGALIAHPDGMVERIDSKGTCWGQDHETPFHIEGCAGDLALGALLMGATAEEAVGICIEHHAYCAGPIQVERLIRSDAPVLARAGEILACENDHPLYRLRTDIGPVNPSDKSPFEPLQPAETEHGHQTPDQDPHSVNPNCPLCDGAWIRSGPTGLSFRVHGETDWRTANAG